MGDEPVVWITPLQPEPDVSSPVFADSVSDAVQSYYKNNNVNRFSSTRPYQREKTDLDPVLTWTEKTVLTSGSMGLN